MPLRRGGPNDPVLSFFVRIYAITFFFLLLCPCESLSVLHFPSPPPLTFSRNFLFRTCNACKHSAEDAFCLCTLIPTHVARGVIRPCISRVYIFRFFGPPPFFFCSILPPSDGRERIFPVQFR